MLYEVVYETTLPPWHYGYEEIEAEDKNELERKFQFKHEAARIRTVKINERHKKNKN